MAATAATMDQSRTSSELFDAKLLGALGPQRNGRVESKINIHIPYIPYISHKYTIYVTISYYIPYDYPMISPCNTGGIPVGPHKAVAEVSRIGHL